MKDLKSKTYKTLFEKSNASASKETKVEDFVVNSKVPIIYVERSSSSIIAGIDETIKYIKKYFDSDDSYELIETGSCGLNSYDPIISISIPGRNTISFKNITFDKVNIVLDSITNHILPDKSLILGQYDNKISNPWPDVSNIGDIPFFKLQNRQILKNFGQISPLDIESYLSKNGYKSFAQAITKHTQYDICEVVLKNGLRGRGGGAFLTGEKWLNALNTGKSQKYFICNADESDPASFSGRLLAESNPHLVIEGILIASYAIGTKKSIIYIRNNYNLAVERLENALNQAKQAGLIGEDIFGSGIDIFIEIFKGPGAYVCGEETALIASIEGKRGTPQPKPPYPSESGLFEQPTVVNNIETICNIPGIIAVDNNESKTKENTGKTKLFSVSGRSKLTGVVEVELGTSAETILKICNNLDKSKIKAIHIGGPSGGFISPDDFNIGLDFDTNLNNAWIGAGSFLILNNKTCIVDTTKYFIEFINNESCGKCIPCREGSQRILEILERIITKPKGSDKDESLLRFKGVTQLEQISKLMQKTSLCGLGQNAPNTILSGLKIFREEYEEHIYERKCEANICRNLKEYIVDVDNCVGCGICAKRCPEDAILGSEHSVHFIIAERCIKCGICEEACKFNAIIVR